MMLKTVEELAKLKIDGIKFHNLNILKGSVYYRQFTTSPIKLLTLEEYVQILIKSLQILPPTTVVYRLFSDTTDDNPYILSWTKNKRNVHNYIDKTLAKLNIYQGQLYKE